MTSNNILNAAFTTLIPFLVASAMVAWASQPWIALACVVLAFAGGILYDILP